MSLLKQMQTALSFQMLQHPEYAKPRCTLPGLSTGFGSHASASVQNKRLYMSPLLANAVQGVL